MFENKQINISMDSVKWWYLFAQWSTSSCCYTSPAGGNMVERRARDRKVVGSNLAGGVSQWCMGQSMALAPKRPLRINREE